MIRSRKNVVEYSEYMVGEDYDVYDNEYENIRLEKIKDIKKLAKEMKGKYGLVFNMYYMDEMSHKEIAQKLSINVGTSKSNLHKAKKKIYDKLKNKKYE